MSNGFYNSVSGRASVSLTNREIKVDNEELQRKIEALNNLLVGSGFSNSPDLRGYGDAFDALNHLYSELKDAEVVLLELIKRTKEALVQGSLEFEIADSKSSSNINTIDGTLVGK